MHNHKLESNGGRRRHEETTVGHTRGEGYEGVMRENGDKKERIQKINSLSPLVPILRKLERDVANIATNVCSYSDINCLPEINRSIPTSNVAEE